MNVFPLLRRAATLPPHVLLRKSWGFGVRQLRAQGQRRSDRVRPSYAPAPPDGEFYAYIAVSVSDIPDDLAAALPDVTRLVLDHRFDLLGSGWVSVDRGAVCAGVEDVRYPPGQAVEADRDGAWLAGRVNAANLDESQKLWRLVNQPDYRPIDWQLDFKSGYRWSEGVYFRDITYGQTPGADIKMPWELARMQHLPWLVVACVLAREGRPGFAPAEAYSREIRSQILDFLATNPPRFGVNWVCPMDVAIRIANWLLTLDILRGAGVEFDTPFRDAVSRAALDHGRHIAAHLEWSETGRSNHYLSDIAGLLFVAAYLPRTAETDAWLAFAIQQLECEIDTQFGADGGNYEGSIAYHCLSAELAVYAVALVLGLPDDKRAALQTYDRTAIRVRPAFTPAPLRLHDLPETGQSPLSPRTIRRVAAMADFLAAVTKPTGHIFQVGDTDSGRLFKLHPVWRELGTAAGPINEDDLDRCALSGAFGALFTQRPDGERDEKLDATIVRLLAKGRTLGEPERSPPPIPSGNLAALLGELNLLPAESRRVTEFPLPEMPNLAHEITCTAFPEFGLFVLRGPRLFLSLRCARHGRVDAPSGHTHDDNLAMELQIDGRDVVVDPGSYLYTAFPEIRERYRVAGAHFAPRPLDRSAVAPSALFELGHIARATCLHCGPDGIAGRLDAPDWTAWRAIEVMPGMLRVTDACAPGALAPVPDDPPMITDGYGKRTATPAYSF